MTNPQDQRRYPRVPLPAESARVLMMMQSASGGTMDQSEVLAHDLSRTGMSFQRAQSVPEGARCVVTVSQSGKALRIIGKVTHSRPVEGGGFLVGLRFVSMQQLASPPQGAVLEADGIVDRLMVDL